MVIFKPFLFIVSCGFLISCTTDSNKLNQNIENQQVDVLNLIPYPQSIFLEKGEFVYNEKVNFIIPPHLETEGAYLLRHIAGNCVWDVQINRHESDNPQLILKLDEAINEINSSPEAYSLEINPDKIELIAAEPVGIMRGIHTLFQIFSNATISSEVDAHNINTLLIPALKITDYPKFEHRGLMLDVCRHFFDTHVMRKYIDALAYYKMNVLHLHLTEDQGWRMPIDKYPLLNEISSWRLDSAGNKYGGFYTKDELNELVEYAEEQYITIIPEIELPGHSQAALAAYPQFSCTGGPIEVVNDWGVFKEIYCAGNDSTFTFIEDILTEVMEIFPSKYIHIGGDEAPKFRWEHCPKCQQRMKDEGLADEHELQSYFIKRIEKFLNDHGRELIGWDEILEGGLSDNAAVQSWRGFEGGMEAARTKHKVIMSPTSHCYLDYGLSSIDLQKIYSFDPIPAELEKKYHPYIIGSEGNMWTEHVPDEANLDSKVFPRLIALAEVLWTYNPDRDFDDFYRRLQTHYAYLERNQIKYGLETIGATLKQEFTDSGLVLILTKNLPDLTVKYAWNYSFNGDFESYKGPITLDTTGILAVQAYKKNVKYGESILYSFAKHVALNKKVTYSTPYNQWYVGNGDKNLVDGRLGSMDFHDGAWQGFWGEDIDVIIDLEESKHFLGVKINFYQYANSWIFLPRKIELETSVDGENWDEQLVINNTKVILTNEKSIKSFSFHNDKYMGMYGRYIRIKAQNIGKVPAGHEAEGQDAWLFIDEIIVE